MTGASDKGTWVRVFQPPTEGKVVHGAEGLDVADRVRVKLVVTNVEQGFIDFARVGTAKHLHEPNVVPAQRAGRTE